MKLVVDDQSSEVFQPSERAFNNPSFWYHLESNTGTNSQRRQFSKICCFSQGCLQYCLYPIVRRLSDPRKRTDEEKTQVENGTLVSVDMEKTGSLMGEDTYNINGLFILPNLSVDTIHVLELDAKKNVMNRYIFTRTTRMLTLWFCTIDINNNEWDTTTIKIIEIASEDLNP